MLRAIFLILYFYREWATFFNQTIFRFFFHLFLYRRQIEGLLDLNNFAVGCMEQANKNSL